jgi:hypothetical protein
MEHLAGAGQPGHIGLPEPCEHHQNLAEGFHLAPGDAVDEFVLLTQLLGQLFGEQSIELPGQKGRTFVSHLQSLAVDCEHLAVVGSHHGGHGEKMVKEGHLTREVAPMEANEFHVAAVAPAGDHPGCA